MGHALPSGKRRRVFSPVHSAALGALDLDISAPGPPDLLQKPGMRIGKQNPLCRQMAMKPTYAVR
jgi:hypothetical protein